MGGVRPTGPGSVQGKDEHFVDDAIRRPAVPDATVEEKGAKCLSAKIDVLGDILRTLGAERIELCWLTKPLGKAAEAHPDTKTIDRSRAEGRLDREHISSIRQVRVVATCVEVHA
ncbi:MAG: hypothetical protein ACJATT_002531 [Myxococcota bacterium]